MLWCAEGPQQHKKWYPIVVGTQQHSDTHSVLQKYFFHYVHSRMIFKSVY